MQYFPDNKTSNFATKLLQLDGEWEVGLAEIDYPHTWCNIREGKILWKFTFQMGSRRQYSALLKTGLSNTTDVVVSYDDTSKRVTVRCAKGTVLELRGDIARMFGYLNNTAIRASDKKGFTLSSPETGNQYFYVYTDIIKSQYHGDAVVPVLRTVTVKGKHGSYVSKNFERPLNKKNL